MKKKLLAIILVAVIMIVFCILLLSKNKKSDDTSVPTLILTGKDFITITENSIFSEPGFEAKDNTDGDLTSKVTVSGKVDPSKPGVYEIIYKVTNSKGKTVEAKRMITVEKEKVLEYKSEYDSIDNRIYSWGTNNKKNGERPITELPNEELASLGAYAMGPDEKVLYLTFDEGSMDTYLKEIVDVLNANDVKGTFFLCKNYIKNNPDLMKSMVSAGHSIGNHTANHSSMPTLATRENFAKFISEITDTEKTFESITGTKLDPVYREPKGEYSKRSLSIVKEFGYRTYFWSAAYKDWDDQLTKEEAYKSMVERVHPGAIFLLHPRSKGNYLALDDFIKNMKNEGYRFDLVKNIP